VIPVCDERHLDVFLYCIDCAHEFVKGDPRCADCECGSLFEANPPVFTDALRKRGE